MTHSSFWFSLVIRDNINRIIHTAAIRWKEPLDPIDCVLILSRSQLLQCPFPNLKIWLFLSAREPRLFPIFSGMFDFRNFGQIFGGHILSQLTLSRLLLP